MPQPTQFMPVLEEGTEAVSAHIRIWVCRAIHTLTYTLTYTPTHYCACFARIEENRRGRDVPADGEQRQPHQELSPAFMVILVHAPPPEVVRYALVRTRNILALYRRCQRWMRQARIPASGGLATVGSKSRCCSRSITRGSFCLSPAGSSVTTFTSVELVDRVFEVVFGEVRPHHRDEHQLGIRQLP